MDVGPIVLRAWPEHDAIYQSTEFPYVLSVQSEKGSLEYVGAKHTSIGYLRNRERQTYPATFHILPAIEL